MTVLMGVLYLAGSAVGQVGVIDEDAIFARSLVSNGDTARLEHVLAKARRGEPVTVAVIGGSITQGAAASQEDFRWGNRVAGWWRETFPEAEITYVNAGIGATGSNIGAHRAVVQLLAYSPDFVGIEFGVNDANDELAAETLEGLVRQILKQPNSPAAMLLFTMNNAGANAQEWHGKIGEHYGLPMVSFRDALWPEIESGRMKWEDVEGDVVHPNDRGHGYCADFVTRAIGRALADLPTDPDLPEVPPIPAPLISGTYEFATYGNADTLEPVSSKGFEKSHATFLGPCWRAEDAASSVVFEVEGTAISLVYYRLKADMGMAKAWVDDGEPVVLQGWFEADWGGYSAYALIASDLAPGKHLLHIEVLPERHEESGGHAFEIHAVMSAGR